MEKEIKEIEVTEEMIEVGYEEYMSYHVEIASNDFDAVREMIRKVYTTMARFR